MAWPSPCSPPPLREGRAGAKSARHAVDHIDAYLAACQLGITLASLGLGVVGEPAFEELLHPLFGDGASLAGFAVAGALSFGLITVLHVVVGELAPKSLAIASTGSVALRLAPFMRAFYLATKPLVDLFNWMGNVLLKPFGIPPAAEAGHAPHSEDELRELLRQSSREGLRAVARPLARVNEAEHPDEVLRDMRRERRHVAVVVDEHGTATGLLSLEDILETIVGSIQDEHDEDAAEVLRQDGEDWIVAGSAPLRDVVGRVGLELGELPHEATIGGHLLEELGRVPASGETVKVDGRAVEVLDADEARIVRLRFPASVAD